MHPLQYGCSMFLSVPAIHRFTGLAFLHSIASPAITLAVLWMAG